MTNSMKRVKILKVNMESTIHKKKVLSRRQERNHRPFQRRRLWCEERNQWPFHWRGSWCEERNQWPFHWRGPWCEERNKWPFHWRGSCYKHKKINDHSIGEGLDVNIRKSMTIPSERALNVSIRKAMTIPSERALI